MYLIFDIGGTKMRLAFSRDGATFDKPRIVKTPKNFEEGVVEFGRLAKEVAGGEKIKVAAGGIAGPFNRDRTELVGSPNLPSWANKPLKKELETAIGAPVYLENDAAIAGLGEATVGAGRGKGIVAYITVSTGVGGARIVDGEIDRRVVSFEPGHQILMLSDELCPYCHLPGHLESVVSGAALKKRYGKEPYEITNPKIWDEMARFLAYGLSNASVFWSPDVIVLGGSMVVKSPGISAGRVAEYLESVHKIFPPPEVVEAKLQDVGGLHGALQFIKQKTV